MRVVIGLGGNALLQRGETFDMGTQRRNAARAMHPIAALAREHQVIITHGNGPQVGYLSMLEGARPTPLDVLDAESAGMIGYLLEQELTNADPTLEIVSVLTRVVVDELDPAFRRPSKPIGPRFASAEADRYRDERGWVLQRDGSQWRRVVASPEPQSIVEQRAIGLLCDAGLVVICDGGGGIPVAQRDGIFVGVEAVVDKDLSTALLAQQLQADALLLLTDVDAVYDGWNTAAARPIRRAAPASLRQRVFAAGSMGPKVEGACRFVDAGGAVAAIGRLDDAASLLNGTAGTRIVRTDEALTYG